MISTLLALLVSLSSLACQLEEGSPRPISKARQGERFARGELGTLTGPSRERALDFAVNGATARALNPLLGMRSSVGPRGLRVEDGADGASFELQLHRFGRLGAAEPLAEGVLHFHNHVSPDPLPRSLDTKLPHD